MWAGIIYLAIGALTGLAGYMIKYRKRYGLVAGYNTMTKEQQKNVDIEGLANLMAMFCFVLTGLMAVGAVFAWLNMTVVALITVLLTLLILPYVLVKAQKFDHNKQGPEQAQQKKTTMILIVISSVIPLLITGGFLWGGSMEPTLTVQEGKIKVGGLIGTEQDLAKVTEVRLEEEMPKVLKKTNAFALGEIRKGKFEVEGLGEGRLYLQSDQGPFIYVVMDDGYMYINFSNMEKTEEAYTQLTEALGEAQ